MPIPNRLRRLFADERAIEGLPVRLVIAFVVGLASLSVMLNMVSGLGGLATSELDARPAPDVTQPGRQTVNVTVVDASDEPVGGATVIVRSDTAGVDGPLTARTGPDGVATLTMAPELPPTRAEGTLEIELKPPAGGAFADRRANTELLVLRD